MSTTSSTPPTPQRGPDSSRPPAWRRRRPGRLARPAAVAAALPLGLAGLAALSAHRHPPAQTSVAVERGAFSTAFSTAFSAAAADNSPTGAGQVGAYGAVPVLGGPGAAATAPVTAIAATPSGRGYWLAGADGGVFAYGDATFHGSVGSAALARPVVGLAATPSGQGYWLAGADGGVFAYGDAGFHGSTGDRALSAPIVGIAATPSGDGYWLVAADGGVFAYGDAGFFGSIGGTHLSQRIVAMAPTADGRGYWLAGADGGVFAFGDAA
ncbi:MAG: hypothetical protein M0Z30_06710, partial [Actinomycetota bacterium]|nr:hypothetical protein [Actinomycetota bacterium]